MKTLSCAPEADTSFNSSLALDKDERPSGFSLGEKGAEASPAAGAAEGEVSGEGLSEELLRLARIARASARAGSSAMLSRSDQRDG